MNVEELPIAEQVKRVIAATGISSLYPPQEEAIKMGALEGTNLVLASPTASGKTLIAELCAMRHVLEKGGKILYLTPLRALAAEKYEEFRKYSKLTKEDGRRVRVAISTGDFDSADSRLGRYDVIVVTNEKCDSLLRHRSAWLKCVSLVVVDEFHFLNDRNRGPTLEVTLTRLMETNPDAQFFVLSATIRNAEDVAEWLKARYVTTEWRPVELREGVYLDGECQFNDGSAYNIGGGEVKDPAIRVAMHTVKQGSQVLIFTETRRKAVSYAKKAAVHVKSTLSRPDGRALKKLGGRSARAGERTRIRDALLDLVRDGVAFHHAGLTSVQRKLVEDAFRGGLIKVIAATPTLAAGVNLPARTVVVSSYERYESGYGRYPIAVLEYKQMAGRAGRPQYDRVGEAMLLSKTHDEREYLMESYVLAKPERIWSKLAVESVLRSHVLASIATGFVFTEQGLHDFFGKTFYAHQYGSDLIHVLVGKALAYLYKEDMVEYRLKHLEATAFGHRVSELYIDPVSAVIIRDGLQRRAANLTNLSFLHLTCHTPDSTPRAYPRRREIEPLEAYAALHEDEYMTPLPDGGDAFTYEKFLGEVKGARILESWIEEVTEDRIIESFSFEPGDLFRLVSTADWLLYAAYELGRLFEHRDLTPEIRTLRQRVNKGVKKELLPLVQLRGVGRVRGRLLFNAHFRTVKALKAASMDQLVDVPLIGSSLARQIKEQVGGVVTMKEWRRAKQGTEYEQKSLSEYQ